MRTHIDADTELFSAADQARCRITTGLLKKHFDPNIFRAPWLDVGAGASYMRGLLHESFGIEPQSVDNDLDVDPYPFADNTFDLITSFELLEHLYNPLFNLMEIHRILKPDGRYIMTTPNDHGLIYKVEHLLNRKYDVHFHQFGEGDIRNIFARSGLKILSLRKFRGRRAGTIARISRNQFLVEAVKV
jgi:SAM-dependent methyltransferase